jgi:hypothetical protein
MKKLNDMKTRLLVRMFCKIAKSRGVELEAAVEMIQAEWDNA